MKNPWTDHVKKFAKKNNMTFKEALSSKKCQKEYKKRRPHLDEKKKTSPRRKIRSPEGWFGKSKKEKGIEKALEKKDSLNSFFWSTQTRLLQMEGPIKEILVEGSCYGDDSIVDRFIRHCRHTIKLLKSTIDRHISWRNERWVTVEALTILADLVEKMIRYFSIMSGIILFLEKALESGLSHENYVPLAEKFNDIICTVDTKCNVLMHSDITDDVGQFILEALETAIKESEQFLSVLETNYGEEAMETKKQLKEGLKSELESERKSNIERMENRRGEEEEKRKSNFSQGECAICYGVGTPEDPLESMCIECPSEGCEKHQMVHKRCILSWLSQNNTNPISNVPCGKGYTFLDKYDDSLERDLMEAIESHNLNLFLDLITVYFDREPDKTQGELLDRRFNWGSFLDKALQSINWGDKYPDGKDFSNSIEIVKFLIKQGASVDNGSSVHLINDKRSVISTPLWSLIKYRTYNNIYDKRTNKSFKELFKLITGKMKEKWGEKWIDELLLMPDLCALEDMSDPESPVRRWGLIPRELIEWMEENKTFEKVQGSCYELYLRQLDIINRW